MFINQEECLYTSIAGLLKHAHRSGLYPSVDAPPQVSPGACISDRLLYVQSNGRTLIGQDEYGRLACIGVAGKRDYPLPTMIQEEDQIIAAQPGMFYQADTAMLLGNINYSVILDNGIMATPGDTGATSCYLEHFLPSTSAYTNGLRLTTISLAPLLERGIAAPLPALQMPGPCGAVYALNIRNETNCEVNADVRLNLSEHFVSHYQFSYRSMEENVHRPFQAEWDQNTLFMWRPDACAVLQAQGFSHAGNPGMPTFSRRVVIAPGEEITLTSYIAISTDQTDLFPALSVLYRHTALEWINVTAAFWRGRLGQLAANDAPELHQRALDFHMRSVLDNFNCYQMDEHGEIIAHLQGAPSQISGRFWGIDAEPTALSVLYALPELAGVILRYVTWRNRPAFTPYRDHSTPIFMAPLIIATRHYELTGDLTPISENAALCAKLVADVRELLSLLHPTGLMPSRFSSDGHVFHRYDFGTNLKAHYAFKNGSAIFDELGSVALAGEMRVAARRVITGIRKHMCADGPFGPQITGGSNMGEHEPFYLRDDLMYYDGEDSSSCMAYLYGAMELTDPLWQNYHRFAHSLFATNYDAENGALRWFAWGAALDGTALVSALGGSTTRAEMAERLKNLLDMATDESGSMFWWPRAKNYVRGLTRCSQGQGAWVFQHTEQWLGLHMDAPGGLLRVQPQGLYDGYVWKGARLGSGRFDIALSERGGETKLTIRNLADKPLRVELTGRAQNEVFSSGKTAVGEVGPQCVIRLCVKAERSNAAVPVDIAAVENAVYAMKGPALGTYLFELPRPSDDAPEICTLPFAILSGPDALIGAALEICVPDAFLIQTKTPAILDESVDFEHSIRLELGDIPPMARLVRSVYFVLPHKYRKSPAWLTRADFACMDTHDVRRALMLQGGVNALLGTLTAELSGYGEKGALVRKRLEIPVEVRDEKTFESTKIALFGGKNMPLVQRMR